ncbi:GNAT family N-acetyltransferase [Pedobacter sp. SYSU D00535]|uniref:GNAT family N-acetyltransferase n=1 Tax=Pedobacter sp. SYSU D00535 TaxID=2810308 RepID=UPI001A97A5CB|nr:GNAT family N-acetyltransferase [Pedobacter sp. SYSU D00535]
MLQQEFIISTKEKWNHFISRSLHTELYHSWNYHVLDKSGEPLLYVYGEEEVFIALPLIKRKIKDSPFFDFSSVYGYAGPVSNVSFESLPESTMENFKAAFISFMKHEKCICVFSRLNPFINQRKLLERIGGIYENGKTIYMDLSTPQEEQYANYEKRLLRQVKQLRKKNYVIKETMTQDDIRCFCEMYWDNMKRVNASNHYFFTREYFTTLLDTTAENSKLLMIYDSATPICGAIVFYSKDVIRNHLSATSEAYLKDSPSKLLTDEISQIGRRLGVKYFHLGGGVGGREDSLFQFKSYFSHTSMLDFTWRFIGDQEAYNSLVEICGLKQADKTNFFPLYRSAQLADAIS